MQLRISKMTDTGRESNAGYEGLEEAQRGTQQETQGYPTRKRQSPARTKAKKRGRGATTKPLLGSNETNKEKKDGKTREASTQGRCIPESVYRNHQDYPGNMVRT